MVKQFLLYYFQTPLQASQNNSSNRRHTSSINGSSPHLGNRTHQHVAARRSMVGFDLDGDDDDDEVLGVINASLSSEEEGEVKDVPQLFVDERDDHVVDKENRCV